jgi:hypothetical protein
MKRLSGVLTLYVLLAAALVLATHGATRHYGFNYDDYHFVRPHSLAEVASTFSGIWDSTGIEVKFYRPLTVVLFAVRFYFFGLNADAYHTLSLVMFGLAAVMLGLLARAFLGSTAGGAFAIAAFALHPAMPYAAVAWVTNQMHLLQMLVVFTALLWWCFVRRRSVAWWAPVAGPRSVSFRSRRIAS